MRTGALGVDQYALYMPADLDLEGAQKQSRTIVVFYTRISHLAPPHASSRPYMSCNKQPAGVLALAKIERGGRPRAGNRFTLLIATHSAI
jgi:hypothetical protein